MTESRPEDRGGQGSGVGVAAEAERLIEAACGGLAARVPRATYRVQLNGGFTFEDARRTVAYLDELGVSDLYTSPFFKACPGSMHGYDLVDHNALSPAIGSRSDLEGLAQELAGRSMGLLLDFVPNHMGICTAENTWWHDVLENGPSSIYAPFFDIDWMPLKSELKNKVLLPVLGDHYGRVLERGELRVELDGGAFLLRFYDHVFPVNPRTYVMILEPVLPGLVASLGAENDAVLELQSVLTGLRNLPPRTETQRAKVLERRREKEILKRRLASLIAEAPEIAAAVAAGVARINGRVGEPRSFDALEALLDEQAYRLSFWRTAAEEINYRRFFDINDLAAIRMENRAVFAEAHRLVFELCDRGEVTGLRIDHPDGLWDPNGYFTDLQQNYLVERCRRHFFAEVLAGAETSPPTQVPRDPRALRARAAALFAGLEAELRARLVSEPRAPLARPLYVVVEKILARGETLPEAWPIHGTSGYDFAAAVGELFVDPASEGPMTEIYERFIGRRTDFDALVYAKKKVILSTSLSSELNVLAHALNRLTERDRRFRDFTLGSLTDALREVIACFPVYRTYIDERSPWLSDHDRVAIGRAVALARRRNPTTEASVYMLLRAALMLDGAELFPAEDRPLWSDFVMKFQQLTGPVMAKGVEDTAFYVYNRLVSLNEVGGEPERYGASVLAFHRANVQRHRTWPASMLATSTHDTKRSEDVRARISVLSEVPSAWDEALRRASWAAAPLKTDVDGRLAPDANEEYLLYQTLLGSLPLALLQGSGDAWAPEAEALAAYTDRIVAYMHKATKEAKVNTSWIDAQPEYDAAVEAFVRRALSSAAVMEALLPLARTAAYHGMWGALSQALLKLTSPGVPDIYQGNEMWDHSLVDPDNRRPVDFARRAAALADLRARRRGAGGPAASVELARELCERAADGRIKLFVTHVALEARRAHPELFGADGAYAPRHVAGERADHVIAFARRAGGQEIVVVATRFSARLLGGADAPPIGAVWAGTSLDVSPGRYRELFTGVELDAVSTAATPDQQDGAALPLDQVLADFPVALLLRAPQRGI